MHRFFTGSSLVLRIPLLLAAAVLLAGCDRGNDQVFDEATDPRSFPPRGSAWVIFDGDTVVAEVADTPAAMERGLMERTEVPDGTGMLFVYEDMDTRQFWMRNTYVPLDIAFLDMDQRIVDIQAMEPETEELTVSAAPAMFALEVRQGWFEEQGIEVGAEARIVFGRR
jgi:uncharacterized protein